METDISLEIHRVTQFVAHGFIREAQTLFKNELKNPYFNIPFAVTCYVLLYYNSNQIKDVYSDESNQSFDQYENSLKVILTPSYLQPYRLIIYSETNTSSIIASFENIKCRTPEGNAAIYFYPKSKYFLLKTETFHYRIKYKYIRRLFCFKQLNNTVLFIVQLSSVIISDTKKCQTGNYLLLEFDESEISSKTINLTKEQVKREYATKNGKQILHLKMKNPTYDILARLFMATTQIKILAARKYKSADGSTSFSCSHEQNEGLLYPLEKSIFFVWEPVRYIKIAVVDKIEILTTESSETFDISLYLQDVDKSLVFTDIHLSEYGNLMQYFSKKSDIRMISNSPL